MSEEADAIEKHLRRHHAELLGTPSETSPGVWAALVAVTPWGPLVRMEFGLSRPDAIAARDGKASK